MAVTLPRRADVPVDETMDLANIYPSDAAWEAAYQDVAAALPGLEPFRGRLGESPAVLLEALQTRDALQLAAGRLGLYARLQVSADNGDQAALARADRAGSVQSRVAAAAAYFPPEILALGPARLDTWMAESPTLAVYRHYFATIERERAHIASPDVERTLAALSDQTSTPYRAWQALSNADLRFATVADEQGGPVTVAQANIVELQQSADRTVRQAAWEAYADGYLGVKNTMAATLAGTTKRNVVYARARNYPSALAAVLAPNAIPLEVFHNLLATYERHLPVWHHYWDVRRRALGVDRLHAYDTHVPLVRTRRPIPFATAVDLICAGMAPLGEEYVAPLRRGVLEERWVDRVRNQGKGNIAFSSGIKGTHPFVMMNYDPGVRMFSTLAHELGHSMHSYFSRGTQPTVYAGYSTFAAEVASNFNQALVRAHLLATDPDPDFQLEVLDETLANFHRYFFIMPALAAFEFDNHARVERGEGLTADDLSARLLARFRAAYGPDVVLDEPRVGITWAQFPHMYMNFYVFQYATGIAAATALARQVRAEGAPAAARYLAFLKAGSSLDPVDALRQAGVDMTTPAPVEEAFNGLAELVDRLDGLVGAGPLVARPA